MKAGIVPSVRMPTYRNPVCSARNGNIASELLFCIPADALGAQVTLHFDNGRADFYVDPATVPELRFQMDKGQIALL